MILSDTQELLASIRNARIDDELCKSAFEDADILIYMVEIGEQDLKDEAFLIKSSILKYLYCC
jgi:GTP-binding protein Era